MALGISNVRAFCFAIVLYSKTYGGPEGPCQTHVYNFKLTFSELDVSNLAKLDISTHIHVDFCTPVSMDSLDHKAVAWLGVCSMHPH